MELAKQVQAGYVAVFPLESVNALHNLWISPIAVIPQVGRRPRLIFYFAWSRINDVSKRLALMEAMRFRGVLQRILKQVLPVDPRLGPVCPIKVDLADTYMRLWVRMEDISSVALFILKKTPVTHIWWDSTSFSPWGT